MSGAWTVAVVLLALVAAGFGAGIVRGAVQGAKEGVRRDLVAFSQTRMVTEGLAKLSATPAYSFSPPLDHARQHPFGWLWWRASVEEDGTVDGDMGWAMTYRRARKAAGIPVSWKSCGELVLAPGTADTSRVTADGK